MTTVRQTLLLAQWQFRRHSVFMPLLVVVQVAIAVATVVGYGLLVGDPTPEVALFLATPVPAFGLLWRDDQRSRSPWELVAGLTVQAYFAALPGVWVLGSLASGWLA